MKTIKARYDGRVIIPEEPVDLPTNTTFLVDLPDGTEPPKKYMTGAELAASEVVGLWKDREDIKDTLEFAAELRRRSNNRE